MPTSDIHAQRATAIRPKSPRLLDEQDAQLQADLLSHSEAILAYLTGVFIEDVLLEDSDEDY